MSGSPRAERPAQLIEKVECVKETQEQIACVFKSVALVFGVETALAG